MSRRVASRQNPLCRHLSGLASDAGYRARCGEYLCDGVKLLDDALQSGVIPLSVAAADDCPLPPLPSRTSLTRMPPRLIETLAPTQTPQGVLFTCSLPTPLAAPPREGKYVLLDGVQDPGNVGSILRTAEAFGLSGAYLLPPCADPFGPKAVRAGMGAVFRLPVGQADCLAMLAGPLPLYATAPDPGALPVTELPSGSCVVALGSEGRGVRRELLEGAARRIFIPMRGGAQSLGVAAAAAVVIWRMSRGDGEAPLF